MTLSCYDMFCVNFAKALCTEVYDMQISEAAGGAPAPGAEPCRFPKLEECAHFHYERVQLPQLTVTLQTNMDQSLLSQHTNEEDDTEWFMVQVTSADACWLVQRNFENFKMLDEQLHQCIFDRKISQLPDLASQSPNDEDLEIKLILYLERFSKIADNSVNCGPVLNWLQMDNKGHRLLVPSEESRSINTPAVAAAYSVRRYVSQARDELNLEVGDMISVIDMASPGESMWWRGKRGFQVGFFPQHCVHIIGDKVPRNMPLPPPVVGSLALTPIKPVLRKHGKLITFFRSFILNRPSRRRLKQSGILKERVFGCDLGEHLLNSGHDIPMVLKCCAEFIEANGIVDGIYRLSGVTSNIQKLRNAFDEDRIPNLYTEDILQDIHSVASLLKMYFRELPNPLCTYQLYQSFVNAVQGCNTAIKNSETDRERLLKMREAVQKLPPPHYRTLEYLMRHLAKVAKHGASTGMTTRNVAIVWAPNLLRCEALEVGGVAALQGVGVQAVVTEFLICYADLIFCDHLPNLDHPTLAAENNLLTKKCRPNSLAISTPTKLITLEEARSKHLPNKTEECNYIEVGGGPKNLPKKYHTIIELPPGARKRGHTKRSPLGWRMFFSKSRNNSQGNLTKNRKASTPITINEKSVTESDLTDMKRKLRTVKSAESLTSGHSEPASTEDVLGPLRCLNKPPGHNRSVSHDSYFDTLQNSQNNSEGSLLDLSEIQLNFELEESEMRIFSEDESLVSSPRIHKETQRRVLTRARPEEFNSAANSVNPSPKKQPRVELSPESLSRKRTRLEDQLSDIQYIDCSTPDNIVSTTAVIHTLPDSPVVQEKQLFSESYQPKNKSPRNSDVLDKRQSLNLETTSKTIIPKSFTELDINRKYLGPASILTTPTPGSPGYKQLGESSANTTPGISPTYDSSPTESTFQQSSFKKSNTPNYENVLTTISITYKSPPRSTATSPVKSPVTNVNSVYENVILNPEKVLIPTSTASLPVQEASQPSLSDNSEFLSTNSDERPKSLSAIEDLNSSKESTIKPNLSSSAICNTSEQLSLNSFNDQKTLSSNQSSDSNIQYTPSISSAPYHYIENSERLSPTDLSLSEVVESSTENLTTSHTSLSFPVSPSKNSLSPNVSPTAVYDYSSQDLLTPISPSENRNTSEGLSTENLDNLPIESGVWSRDRPTSVNLIDFSPVEAAVENDIHSSPNRASSSNDKRKSDETESLDDNAIYQQVKYFRRSIHEVNALLDLENGLPSSNNDDESSENVYEDVTSKSNSIEAKEELSEIAEAKGDRDESKERLQAQNEAVGENYDSLENENPHVYENIEGDSLHEENVYEDVELNNEKTESLADEIKRAQSLEQNVNVRDLASVFEEKEAAVAAVADTTNKKVTVPSENAVLELDVEKVNSNLTEESTNANGSSRCRKFYEKDSLPPCLRARNLKHQLKTRSLDEEEFNKEFGINVTERRKSLDESLGYKTNSLPKTLNQPKSLPRNDSQVDSIHLAHSSENVGNITKEEEEQKKRERIERYKEERRKILQDKYRSESFKEDKEVLLTRLRIYKHKDDNIDPPKPTANTDKPPHGRRRSTHSNEDSAEMAADSLEEDSSSTKQSKNALEAKENQNHVDNFKKETKPMKESLKSRAAIFEQNNQRISAPADLRSSKNRSSFREPTKQTDTIYAKNLLETREKVYGRTDKKENFDDLKDLDFIRPKRKDDDFSKEERRRHTFDSRERETESDRLRRISLENRSPKKEKTSPTYCIKDMKALFESKSKQ
ncbi:GTPase-activating protein CdGAPr isoform X2 [Anoplophora glabripennis]|uniref:GTPase-activating protein CdGAPr isoform X2 n=1 Tax=Anoplophora glabripennis TaxID=217634 RepID=UPI000874713A|nr:GTPase-activating protein CdGAPr isoform X2 [Anoplophora glabripennis]